MTQGSRIWSVRMHQVRARVRHIVENKRLGAVLALVKE
jgi:hypothetical protein